MAQGVDIGMSASAPLLGFKQTPSSVLPTFLQHARAALLEAQDALYSNPAPA
jgi:hypothetical protein